MTTERQRRANRLNAMKSTGPRTAKGKERSSKNSRKHGLLSGLAKDDVDRWLRTILDINPDHLDVDNMDPRFFAALELAEAEAMVERAQQFEELLSLDDYLGGPEPPPGETALLEALIPEMEAAMGTREWSPEDWAIGMSILRLIDSARRQRARDFEKNRSLSRRYRRTAENLRHRALTGWLEGEKSETNPIYS